MLRALVVSPEELRVAAHPDPAVTAEMLRAARDHDVARAALDDAARDDAALDHDLRAGRDAGHHLLALHITRVCGQHRPCGCARLELLCSVYLVLRRRAAPIYCARTAERKQRAIANLYYLG